MLTLETAPPALLMDAVSEARPDPGLGSYACTLTAMVPRVSAAAVGVLIVTTQGVVSVMDGAFSVRSNSTPEPTPIPAPGACAASFTSYSPNSEESTSGFFTSTYTESDEPGVNEVETDSGIKLTPSSDIPKA